MTKDGAFSLVGWLVGFVAVALFRFVVVGQARHVYTVSRV